MITTNHTTGAEDNGRAVTARPFWPFTKVRAEEGTSVAIFACYAFVLLICYYVLKTLREPLLLENGSAELKSYAYAVIALILLLLIPLYGVVFRHTRKRQLIRWITIFFAVNLAVFYGLGRTGTDIGFVYYVWVGIFGLTMLAQFWAHAAHVYGVERGQRLFPVIMVGAAVGGLIGPLLCDALFESLGAWNLMLVAIGLLLVTCSLVSSMRRLSDERLVAPTVARKNADNLLGGLSLVLRDRYLLLLAALALLLNCVNTTGEYMLAELVVRHVDSQVAQDPSLDKDVLIGSFYANFFFSVNVSTVILQVFLVGRVFRWIGMRGALYVLPVIALIGYGLVAFIPVFAIVRAVKIFENSTDYSLMNTARHALYLPLPVDKKYEGKTAIDTFFWRLGDVAQAGVVFVGLNWLGFEFQDFAMLNMALALVWLLVAFRLGRSYTRQVEPETPGKWRGFGAAVATATLAFAAIVLSASASAARDALFEQQTPLELEFYMDTKDLCRVPTRKRCEDAPATLSYMSEEGTEHRVEASVRVRGRWRAETGDCSFPALFVFFAEPTTHGTLFEGESMLPLTTHCKKSPSYYEQYVLKEYLAYRIYNVLTDKSLRVRLAHITYHDTGKPGKSLTRYGFFTEHFDALAARHDAEVWKPERFDPSQADDFELGLLELFQYMIGNTDWSVIYGHNIVLIRDRAGLPTAVPYDFDFSGLVNAEYAEPSSKLPIKRVTDRLYRGFCRQNSHWPALLSRVQDAKALVGDLRDLIPGRLLERADGSSEYLGRSFDIIEDETRREANLAEVCRKLSWLDLAHHRG